MLLPGISPGFVQRLGARSGLERSIPESSTATVTSPPIVARQAPGTCRLRTAHWRW